MGLNDYDKENPREFKGIKCIFSTMYNGKLEYISSGGKFFSEMSLTPKGFLTKIMQPLTNSVSLDIKEFKTVSMQDWFRGKLGTQLNLQIGLGGKDKNFNTITGYARTTTMDPATNQLVLVGPNMNIPNLNIPKMFFTDAIDFVVLPTGQEVAAPVAVQAQAPAPVQAVAPAPIAPVQQAAPAPIQPVQPLV